MEVHDPKQVKNRTHLDFRPRRARGTRSSRACSRWGRPRYSTGATTTARGGPCLRIQRATSSASCAARRRLRQLDPRYAQQQQAQARSVRRYAPDRGPADVAATHPSKGPPHARTAPPADGHADLCRWRPRGEPAATSWAYAAGRHRRRRRPAGCSKEYVAVVEHADLADDGVCTHAGERLVVPRAAQGGPGPA